MAWNAGVDTRLTTLDFSAVVFQIRALDCTTVAGVPSPESGDKLNHQTPRNLSEGRLGSLLAG
jgi:hypothetical protein